MSDICNGVTVEITVSTHISGGYLSASNRVDVSSDKFDYRLQEAEYVVSEISALIMEWFAKKQRSLP